MNHNLQTVQQKTKSPPRLISTLTKSFVLYLITCYNLLTTQQRFDSRGVLDIQYRPMYFYIYPYTLLLSPVCTVHYNRAPTTSATPHVWNQNSLVVQTMFISSHENEHSLSNEAQRLVYRQLRRRTKRRLRDTRNVADTFLVHSSVHISPDFFTPLTIVKITHF